MSLSASKGRLEAVTKELALRWDETRNFWRDQKSEDFERRYLRELFAGVHKSVAILEKLDELLKKVRSDCD